MRGRCGLFLAEFEVKIGMQEDRNQEADQSGDCSVLKSGTKKVSIVGYSTCKSRRIGQQGQPAGSKLIG